jgi:uncharacterized protein
MSSHRPVEAFEDRSRGEPHVRGDLHPAAGPSGDALVLTHGAGSSASHPFLVALAATLADRGLTVLRCDLPYRQARRTGPPPRGSAAVDREGLRRAVEAVRERVSGRVFLGGQSYGGRQATMLAAESPGLVAGLLVLSYPLHPPRRSSDLRTAHFPALRTPALFVHGTADPFGSQDEMRVALPLIGGPVSLVVIDRAGHDLANARRPAAMRETAHRIATEFLAWIGTTPGQP